MRSNAFSTTGDDVYATGTPSKNGSVTGDFSFADFTSSDIPDSSTINSVTFTIEWALTAAVNGGQIQARPLIGISPAGSFVTKTSTTEAQDSVPCDLTTPSLSDLRSASTQIRFTVTVSKGNTNSAMTGRIDFISMTVDYTAPSSGGDEPAYPGYGYYGGNGYG